MRPAPAGRAGPSPLTSSHFARRRAIARPEADLGIRTDKSELHCRKKGAWPTAPILQS
jgi:hypothetical protein